MLRIEYIDGVHEVESLKKYERLSILEIKDYRYFHNNQTKGTNNRGIEIEIQSTENK